MTAGSSSDAIANVQKDQTAFGIFIGFFVIGFVILILLWTCLLCCCCCPSCCPSKCCQKNENEQYTKCELYWPSITLILCLLLIIVATSLGISKASGFAEGLDSMTCAASIMFDDIINGNVTADGQYFFIGVSQLITEINNLNTNIGSITSDINNLSGAQMTTAKNDIGTAKANVQKVPANVLADGNAVITYTTPIDQTYASGNPTITSFFGSTVLGSSNNGGIVGEFYSSLNLMYNTIDGIISSSTSFSSSTGAFTSAIGSVTGALDGFKNTLNDLNTSVDNALGMLDSPKTVGTMAIQIFYAVALGLSILALVGVVLMTFCDKFKCRYLMYFACVILFFFGLIGFLIAIIFSFIVPVMYWGCDWIGVTIGSAAGFNTNLQGLITDANTRNYIAPCLKGGNGDLITAVAPSSAATLKNLSSTLTSSNSFNADQKIADINTALSTIQTQIDNFNKGYTPDITDTSALAALVGISDPANFNTGGCTGAIGADSWPVSNGNSSFTPCKISGTVRLSSDAACNSRANIMAAATTCKGCMDTTSIFNAYYTAVARGSLVTDLNTRYSNGCPSFTTAFGNIWDNYYFNKIPAFTAISARWTTASTSVGTIITDLGSVNTTISSVMTSLSTAVDGITNPTFGLIAGLNCLLIGEDINLVVSTLCVSNFNTLYITRLVMGISSFGILFALCCIVCSGVRHYKHSERKDKISPNFMDGKLNSFEDTDAAFKH